MQRLALVLVLTLISTGNVFAADGAIEDFLGLWRNVDHNAEGVIRLHISPYREDRVSVQAVGRCGHRECELGTATGQLFLNPSESASDADFGAILVRFNRETIAGNVLLRLNRRGDIVSHSLLTFKEGGGNVYRIQQFERARGDARDFERPQGYSRDDESTRWRRYRG